MNNSRVLRGLCERHSWRIIMASDWSDDRWEMGGEALSIVTNTTHSWALFFLCFLLWTNLKKKKKNNFSQRRELIQLSSGRIGWNEAAIVVWNPGTEVKDKNRPLDRRAFNYSGNCSLWIRLINLSACLFYISLFLFQGITTHKTELRQFMTFIIVLKFDLQTACVFCFPANRMSLVSFLHQL